MGSAAQEAVYHVVALGFFTYVSYRVLIEKKVSPDPVASHMRKFSYRFLTNWTFIMQMVYFSLCVLSHLVGLASSSLRFKMNRMTSFMAVSLTAPMSLVVSLAFWSIYLVDRELVFPKALDDILPPFLNHSIHTLNFLLALGDLLLVRYHYPSSNKRPIQAFTAYQIAYAFCLFGTYFTEGVWLYPFLNKLTVIQIVLMSIIMFFLSLFSYFIIKALHWLRWGSQGESHSKKNVKKKK